MRGSTPKLAVGQVWKTRGGGEALVVGLTPGDMYPFKVEYGSAVATVTEQGRWLFFEQSVNDLVEFVRYNNQEEMKMKKERTPHKHADLIKAWADGAEIQYRSDTTPEWEEIDTPAWLDDVEYRIKPENQIRYCAVVRCSEEETIFILSPHRSRQEALKDALRPAEKVLRIEIDPDTLSLVSAEMEDV